MENARRRSGTAGTTADFDSRCTSTARSSSSSQDRESYQNLFQLAEHVRNVIVQGIDDIERGRGPEGEGSTSYLLREGLQPEGCVRSGRVETTATRSKQQL